jgi:hypothetical protein
MTDVPKFAPCSGGSIFGRFAARDPIGDGHCEMRANFVVEVEVAPFAISAS